MLKTGLNDTCRKICNGAWGRNRNPFDWSYNNIPEVPDWLYRGYTGHEHLPEFGLINMNGRLYDPALGRMLSPDNYVQSPFYSQSYNRYSYVWNNPLKFTDPSGEYVQFIIGAVVGGVSGYMTAHNNGHTGWNKVWYTLGGAAIGTRTAGAGTAVSSSVGIGAGGAVGGAVGGAGFSTLSAHASGVRGGDLFVAGLSGAAKGTISGWSGSIVAGTIGGGFGAIVGGATSNLVGQTLSNNFSFKDINWMSVGLSSAGSWGIFHISSYINWRNNVKDLDFYGRSINYRQYLKMQSSYTRGRIWNSERAGGGFWLTKNGISRQGISYPKGRHDAVSFDFSQKPADAWATFHPHPFNENQVVDGNLWHSSYDYNNVSDMTFSSMIINKHGAELVVPTTPITEHRINFWSFGKPYYIFPW